MDATVDYPSLSNSSDMDSTEDASSNPEPNCSDPSSPSLSNAVFWNSSDIVCISSDKSEGPPLPKKKPINFF